MYINVHRIIQSWRNMMLPKFSKTKCLVISLMSLPVAFLTVYGVFPEIDKVSAAPKMCLPCKPVAAGGLAYEYHSAAAGNDPHNGMPDHTHHFKMNQTPLTATDPCRCFWQRDFVKPTAGKTPTAGAVLVAPVSGGGVSQ
jgi:hypothetical protein